MTKTLKQKHQILINLLGEQEAVQKLHGFYDRQIKKHSQPKVDNNEKIKQQINQIIAHLNSVTGLSYRTSSKETKALIRSRIIDGFQVEDFKKVHIIKTKKWLADPKMRIYLRPSTLYRASHFESYLQEYNLWKRDKENALRKRNNKQEIRKLSEKEENEHHQKVMEKIRKMKEKNPFNSCSPHPKATMRMISKATMPIVASKPHRKRQCS